MAKTSNYEWDLPSPTGIQITEIARIATTFSAIDVKFKSFETALATHKHAFVDLTGRPTTLGGYGITDGMTAQEVANAIKAATDELIGGSSAALDTLRELADALGNDPNFATSVGDALGVRVRVDAAQSFTIAQKARGRGNIDAVGTSDVGVSVAPLGSDGKVPPGYLPALTTTATVGAAMAGANGKTTPADGDFFAGVEAGGSTMFKTTWANIKAALSALFIKKSGDILTGSLGGIAATTAEDWLASFWADSAGGAYVNVPKRRVPFKAQTTTIGNSYAPVLNAQYNTSAWGGIWSQGVINTGNNAQATSYQIVHMHLDGQALTTFTFAPSGEFGAAGNIRAGAWLYANGHIQSGGVVYAGNGSAIFYQDGNLSGPRWGGGYLYDWIEQRCAAWARQEAGYKKPLPYAGDWEYNPDFPVGTTVGYVCSSQTRPNAWVDVYVGNGAAGVAHTFNATLTTGARLSGAWRHRGITGQQGSTGWWGGIAERVG